MKKTMFVLVSILVLSFMACSKSDDVKQPTEVSASTKKNWLITLTSVISVVPSMPGFPYSTVTPVVKDGLTAAEADDVIKELSTTTSKTSNGYTYTTVITGTKKAK